METLGALGGRTLLHRQTQVVLRAPVGLSAACLGEKLSDVPPEFVVILLVKAWSIILECKVPCEKGNEFLGGGQSVVIGQETLVHDILDLGGNAAAVLIEKTGDNGSIRLIKILD